MDDATRTRCRGALLGFAALLAVVACENEAARKNKVSEAQLNQLVHWLPGSYDNRAQRAADLKAGRAPHAPVALEVVAVDSLMLGDHVFYEQRTDDDASGHVKEQRLYSVSLAGGRIVQTVWSLKEPRRWVNGTKDPELFTALQPPDVKQLNGCEIRWEVVEGKLTGKGDREKCHVPAPEGGVPAAVETHLVLDHDGLDWGERGFDPDGKPIYGAENDPLLFRRRAAP